MKNKILLGILIASMGIGGIVYAKSDVDNQTKEVSSVDYTVKSQKLASNKTSRDFKYNDNYRACYNRGLHHRDLTDEEIDELKQTGQFKNYLGMTESEYNNLTDKEKNELFNRVRENRDLSDEEIEKMIKSGHYCYYYNLTEDEYNSLSDEEKEDMFSNRGYNSNNRRGKHMRHNNGRGHHSNNRRNRGCH